MPPRSSTRHPAASGIAHAMQVRLDHVIGNRPGAAMHDQNGIGWQVVRPRAELSGV
jgi:hypothetical protein